MPNYPASSRDFASVFVSISTALRSSFLGLALLAGNLGAAVPAPAEEDPVFAQMSPFGIGSCRRTSFVPEFWVPQMAAIGIQDCRNTRLSWEVMEPKKGEWAWEKADERRQVFADHKMRVGGTLMGNPKWVKGWKKQKKGPGLPVSDLPAWSNYVYEVVKHCKDQIKYWEIWNEPPNFTYQDQTAKDYGKVVATAYDAAKKADPGAKIGLATKSAHIQYLQDAINAGAKNKFDYVTLHPYEMLGSVLRGRGTEAVFMSVVPNVRAMLRRVNPEKADVPVIYTELGVSAAPTSTRHGHGPEGQAYGLVKAMAMCIAQGVTSVNWFQARDGDSGPMGLLEKDGTPRPSYTAMGQLIKHLGHHPEFLGWTRLNGKHWAFFFQGPAGPAMITWAYRNQPDQLDFGQEVQIVDPLTGNATNRAKYQLTRAPAIVLGPPEKLLAEAKAKRDEPMLWDGHDYSEDQTVSIHFKDGKSVERGLHTNAADEVAADVIAYGGSARAGTVPGGTTFIVDPSFLGGQPTPLRISAVVRRNDNNDPAGFRLNYEGPGNRNGYKLAPDWYEIPDNKEWHTATFDLPDAYFVYMYGFNFSFDSQGKKFNKYYLQSVTVEKLPPKTAAAGN
ncbi:MAG: endo-1,4-beta-xylanase [Verrucomicrobiota bacterium]